MNENQHYNIEEHKKLEEKYNHLINKHQRLQNRLDSVIKFSDKQLGKLFEELAKYSKLDKRVASVIKQSDRQISQLISQINDYVKLDKRFNIIIKHSDKQERQILEQKQEFEQKFEEEMILNQEQQKLLKQQTKLAAMGEMIGNISHQFKQPLSVISTIVTTIELKHSMSQLSDEEMLEKLENVSQNVDYLSHTIDDFRNFFDENKLKREFSLKQTIEKAHQLLGTKFHNHSIKLINSSDDATILGIQNDLIQVLMNFLSNSIFVIKNKEKPRVVIAQIEKNETNVTLSIKDNGGGIKEDIIDDIFNANFTTKNKSDGSGIGLYMSKKIIVEHFKGTITASNSKFNYHNNEYYGANFTITFPL